MGTKIIRADVSIWQRFLLALLLFAGATTLIFFLLERPPLGVDDAFIFFTYGQNVADGHGLVFNPGGERVEGFSSPLWMGIVTAAHLLFARPELPLLLINLILISLGLAVLWRHVDGGNRPGRRGLLLLVWTVGAPAYILWMSITLMDTALWSTLLILTAVTVLYDKLRPRRLALLAMLLVLARPEGMAWAPFYIGIAAFLEASRHGFRPALRAIRNPVLAYLMTLTLLIVARLAYFGYPLPNTYYAKLSSDVTSNLLNGLRYLRDFLWHNPHVLFLGFGLSVAILLLNTGPMVRGLWRPSSDSQSLLRSRLVATSLIVLCALAIPVWMGGDHFDLFRFFQPPWPLFLLPTLALVDVLQLSAARLSRYGIVAVALSSFLLAPTPNWPAWESLSNIEHEMQLGARARRAGAILNEYFGQDGPSVGAILVGGLGLEYNGPVVDLMGLNNVEMAHAPGLRYGLKNHSAFNSEVFMAQRPMLLLAEPIPDGVEEITPATACHEIHTTTLVWPNSVLKGLLEDDRFWQIYDRIVLSDNGTRLLTYVERTYVQTLREQGFTILDLHCPDYYDQLLESTPAP